VLGVIDAETNFLIETVPQGSGSHSVAADSKRNLIFVPQVAPVAAVGSGGDTTAVGAGICGTANDNTGTGCVGVYIHRVDHDGDDHDHDHGDHDHDH
jgi:DNA-binding beta-propeller fold protein YncE